MTSPSSSIRGLAIWRVFQVALAAAGVALLPTLIWMPDLGIDLFWNILIPVAPAVLVLIPGVWRNICPMATAGLLPRHFGFSRRKTMPQALRSIFVIISLVALLLIVPFRHAVLNTDGPATALMLAIAAITAFLLGTRYEWRSAWCSSLCPIHPVEKLYGTVPAITVPNVHCTQCEKCVAPCPDSTHKMTPMITNTNKSEKTVGRLLVGGFFGYVYGWYQVPDYFGAMTSMEWTIAFAWPFGGFVVSYLIFCALMKIMPKQDHMFLIRIFAMAAVSTYYWFRLPMLFGYAELPNNSTLIDLTGTLPAWFPEASQVATTLFFAWFMLVRKRKTSWTARPAYSEAAAASVLTT